MPRARLALAGVVLAGGALRFGTLGVQSVWYDEAVTAGLVRRSFAGMLSAIPGIESTPPLFWVLLWPWTRVVGRGELGLRSLSALCGTLAIAAAYLLGRRLGGTRAGLIAAALVAASPLLIWYSQEARAYALLSLLSLLGLIAFLDALEAPSRRALLRWALVSVLALTTHYFALFPVALEAALLVRRHRGAAILPAGIVGAATLALAPLAIVQSSDSRAGFIRQSPLTTRLVQVPKQFLVGYHTPAQAALTAAALLLAAGAGALAIRRGRGSVRLVAGIALGAFALPLLGALAGADYFITRNLIALLIPALALLAVGLAAASRRAGVLAAGALVALGLTAFALVETHPLDQRPDARAAARALGPADGPEAVIGPAQDLLAVAFYRHDSQELGNASVPVLGLTWVRLTPEGGLARELRAGTPPAVPPAFRPVAAISRPTYTIMRWRAATPQLVSPADLGSPGALGFNLGR